MKHLVNIQNSNSTVLLAKLNDNNSSFNLSPIDQIKFQNFKSTTRKTEFLKVRELLFYCFKEYIQVDYNNDVPFFFYDNQRFELSITHALPYIGIQYSKTDQAGLDVEFINRPFQRITHKFLSNQEMNILNNQLYLGWSAKEAAYKYCNQSHYSFINDLEILATDDKSIEVFCKNENIVLNLAYQLIEDICLVYAVDKKDL